MSERSRRHAMPTGKKRGGLLLKAGIAGGAGIALLVGGAGTFAAWNSQTKISGGTIQTGHLDLGNATSVTCTWYDVTNNTTLRNGATTKDIGANSANWTPLVSGSLTNTYKLADQTLSDYQFAPGDVIEGSCPLTIDAQGNNLRAQVSLHYPSDSASNLLTGGGTGLSNQFNSAVKLDTASATYSPSTGTPALFADGASGSSQSAYDVVTSGNAAETISVNALVVVQLQPGSGNTSQNDGAGANGTGGSAINLNNIYVDLTQYQPAQASPSPVPSLSGTGSTQPVLPSPTPTEVAPTS